MEILYKKFSEEYLQDVIELEKIWIKENITYGIEKSDINYFVDSNRKYFLIALKQNKVIGYIICEIINKNEYNIFPKDASFLRVNDIYVLEEYRNQKVGEKLLHEVEKEAKNDNIKHIFISTATKDTDKITRFYKRNGYKIWTTSLFKNIE